MYEYIVLYLERKNHQKKIWSKKKVKFEKNIPPQLCFLNGSQFLVDAPWIADYIAELTILKDKYARGSNKKQLPGIMSVYPRPTFKADISSFLTKPE